MLGIGDLFYFNGIFLFVLFLVFGSLIRIRHFHKQTYEALMLLVWQGSKAETRLLAAAMYQFGPTAKHLRRQFLKAA
jgi:surface polysaccharide O-acyltransferase-like enzyme